MTAESKETKLAAIAVALIAPPVVTYALSSLIPERGLDIFSVLFIQAAAFGWATVKLQPRPSSAVIAGVFYFPFMFALIFWIGFRAGYYDLP